MNKNYFHFLPFRKQKIYFTHDWFIKSWIRGEEFSRLEIIARLISKNPLLYNDYRLSVLIDNDSMSLLDEVGNRLFHNGIENSNGDFLNQNGYFKFTFEKPQKVKKFGMVFQALGFSPKKESNICEDFDNEVFNLFDQDFMNRWSMGKKKLYVFQNLIPHQKIKKLKHLDGELLLLSKLMNRLTHQMQLYCAFRVLGYNEEESIKLLSCYDIIQLTDWFRAIEVANLENNSISLEADNPPYKSQTLDELSKRKGIIKAFKLAKHYFNQKVYNQDLDFSENHLLQTYIHKLN